VRHDSEARLQALLSSLDDVVFELDKDGTYLGIWTTDDTLLAAPRDELLGATIGERIGEEAGLRFTRIIRHVLITGRSETCEYSLNVPAGTRWFQGRLAPIAAGPGRPTSVCLLVRDITVQKLAEQALTESEERFRSIFEQAPIGIVCLDVYGHITDANHALCEIVGRPLAELDGSFQADLFDGAPELTTTPAGVKAEDKADHSLARPGWRPRQVRRPDGTVRVVQVNDVVVNDKDGGSHAVVATVEDITDRLRLAEELRQAQQMEAVGQLAGGIAHEINTPTQFISDNLTFLSDIWGPVLRQLAVSRSAAARLREGGAPDDVASMLEQGGQEADLDFVEAEVPTALSQSQEGIERVATIVRAMKAFGRPDPSEPEPTDLNRLVTYALTMACNELKYVAEVTTDLGALPTVSCFPGAIGQVVVNLLVNAAYAVGESRDRTGERGEIKVKTWAERERVALSVSDTGPGIPADIRPRIFQPFFTTKPFGRGSGQGLALAWATVVDRHAGRIDVASSAAGTTFTVRLPVMGPPAGTHH
jgi:PAS domain S-box-containing protein